MNQELPFIRIPNCVPRTLYFASSTQTPITRRLRISRSPSRPAHFHACSLARDSIPDAHLVTPYFSLRIQSTHHLIHRPQRRDSRASPGCMPRRGVGISPGPSAASPWEHVDTTNSSSASRGRANPPTIFQRVDQQKILGASNHDRGLIPHDGGMIPPDTRIILKYYIMSSIILCMIRFRCCRKDVAHGPPGGPVRGASWMPGLLRGLFPGKRVLPNRQLCLARFASASWAFPG